MLVLGEWNLEKGFKNMHVCVIHTVHCICTTKYVESSSEQEGNFRQIEVMVKNHMNEVWKTGAEAPPLSFINYITS